MGVEKRSKMRAWNRREVRTLKATQGVYSTTFFKSYLWQVSSQLHSLIWSLARLSPELHCWPEQAVNKLVLISS